MKQKKLRRVLLITALILAVQMFFSIVSYATTIQVVLSPTWNYTKFGLPEGYRQYKRTEQICDFPLASTENQYPQTYAKISFMPSNHRIALVIEPLLGKDVDPLDVNETNSLIIDRQMLYANQTVRLQYTKIDEETGEAEGMTLTQCVIRQVCKNETGLTLEEGDYIWVKEDYFLYFSGMEDMNQYLPDPLDRVDDFYWNDTKIYSPYGEDLAPLEYKSLVFADIYEDATETTVLDIDPVHFTVDGPVGRNTPEREKSGFYASEEHWHRQFAEKFFEEFGVKPGSDPATTDDSSLPSWILPGAVGFASGGAVCTAALLTVFAAKKRKKQQPPQPDKTE